MKAFNIWWAIILGLAIFTNQLQADTNLQITYKYEYLKAFAVNLQGLENQSHSIQLKDEHGTILIEEKVAQQAEFGRMYNLENLPEGNYKLVVENDRKLTIQPVIIHRRFLTIDKSVQKEILKPAIIVKSDFIAINMLHFEKEAIFITVENQNGEVVFTDSFKSYGSLNKQLNIRNLPKGNYSFIIQTNAYEVTKDFTKGLQPILLAGKF